MKHMSLSDLIKDWETRMGFSISTIRKARDGSPVRAGTAFRLAKELGGLNDEEARAIAAEYAPSDEDKAAS